MWLGVLPTRDGLVRGRKVLEDSVQTEIVGFQVPYLASCDNLFQALESEGKVDDSSRHVQNGRWNSLDSELRLIAGDLYKSLQYLGQLGSRQLTTDYGWHLPSDNLEIAPDLTKDDLTDLHLEAGILLGTVFHVSRIREAGDGFGFWFIATNSL